MRILDAAFAVVALLALSACTSPGAQYCQSAAECDENVPFLGYPIDGVGSSDDSIRVCTSEVDGYLTSLRQNSEQVCQDLASAYEAWFDCINEENDDCDAWYDNECDNEREDIQDLRNDADNRCNE